MTDSEIFRQPLCLVDSGPDGKMTVNTHVLNQLKSLDKEVVVVSIAGPYRTGKSYLMNKLAGQNKGFALGSTIQSQTKGIWIWIRNHPIYADKYLVLLDTEGLGDVEKGDEDHDNQILCLSVLLASTLVFNVIGVIGNDSIKKFHFIAELSKHIQARSNTDSSFDVCFPDFVFAIRDLELDLEIDGKEVSADEYLEHSLTMKEGTHPDVESFNKIRSCICRYFKKRKCFTFVKPMAGKCRDLDEVTDDRLLPQFRKETQDFLDFIFRESPVKEVGGKSLSGRMFGSLVEVYVEQMKTGVPYVENAVETMARLENSKAKDEASSLYYNLMLESLKMPIDDDAAEFSRCHNNCFQKAIDLFLSKAVFDKNQTFQRELNEGIYKKYRELVQTNEDKCQALLKELYEPIKKSLKAGVYTRSGGFPIYRNDMKDFEDTYTLHVKSKGSHQKQRSLEKSCGSLIVVTRLTEENKEEEEDTLQIGRSGVKPKMLLEFLDSKQVEKAAAQKVDEMITRGEKREKAERQKTIEAQRIEAERVVALRARLLAEQQRVQRAHAENVARLEKQMKEQNEAARKRYKEVIDHRLKEQRRLLEEGFKRDADQMRAKIDDLRRLQLNQDSDSDDDWL